MLLNKNFSLSDFQKVVEDVYGLPDDRDFSIFDMLTHQQRFAMRALKGVRKDDKNRIKLNLLISASWTMSIANRLHINVEEEVWKRFPMLCSYCGKKPCACKKIKPTKRLKVKIENSLKPKNLFGFQKMFAEIYPPKTRTLQHAGIHFAEEDGEVSEAIHNYLGQHKPEQFKEVQLEIADFISCFFGLANSADIDVSSELQKMFKNGCHACKSIPCKCSFEKVATIKT